MQQLRLKVFGRVFRVVSRPNSKRVIKNMQTAMIRIRHLVDDQSTRQNHLRPNRATITVNEIAAVHRPADIIKNLHVDAAQAAAVIVVAIRVNQTHVIQIDLESIQDVNVRRRMIVQANRAKAAATNVINTQEKKPTLEVIATKEVAIEFYSPSKK